VRDVAKVEDANEEVRVITRLDGKPCVKLSVLKQADANTVEVAKAVNRRIQELQPSSGRHQTGMVRIRLITLNRPLPESVMQPLRAPSSLFSSFISSWAVGVRF
jgi:hypothetical protein